MQLANLCGETDTTCLSRSASDAADRRPSYPSTTMPPPMPDGNGDSSKSKLLPFIKSTFNSSGNHVQQVYHKNILGNVNLCLIFHYDGEIRVRSQIYGITAKIEDEN